MYLTWSNRSNNNFFKTFMTYGNQYWLGVNTDTKKSLTTSRQSPIKHLKLKKKNNYIQITFGNVQKLFYKQTPITNQSINKSTQLFFIMLLECLQKWSLSLSVLKVNTKTKQTTFPIKTKKKTKMILWQTRKKHVETRRTIISKGNLFKNILFAF